MQSKCPSRILRFLSLHIWPHKLSQPLRPMLSCMEWGGDTFFSLLGSWTLACSLEGGGGQVPPALPFPFHRHQSLPSLERKAPLCACTLLPPFMLPQLWSALPTASTPPACPPACPHAGRSRVGGLKFQSGARKAANVNMASCSMIGCVCLRASVAASTLRVASWP